MVVAGLAIRGFGEDRARRIKKELAESAVRIEQLAEWRTAQEKAIAQRDADIEDRIRESLEMFHDVQTAASSIIRSAERLQAAQVGRTDEERFAALPVAAQTLVKAASLLELRLRTMPIVTNPAAAEYGNRIRRPIYRIVDLLVRTLQPMATQKKVALSIRGTSHKAIPVFESFDLLPLILIENGIKYSAPDRPVVAEVNDTKYGVTVSVHSFSPWVDVLERQLIFQRRFRGSSARVVKKEGYGLGLSIAETVATAHDTHVLHWTDDGDDLIAGVRYAANRFAFTLRG